MASERVPIGFFESQNGHGRQRMLRKNGRLAVELFSGRLVQYPDFESANQAVLSVKPRNLPLEILSHEACFADGTPIHPSLVLDLEQFVAIGAMGGLTPLPIDFVSQLNLSRGIGLLHPSTDQVIHASGVGIFRPGLNQRNEVQLDPPNPSMTVREYAQQRGWTDGMATAIPQADGTTVVRDNRASLGTYVLGNTRDLALPPDGTEMLLRKVATTSEVGAKLAKSIKTPTVLMYGGYSTFPGLGWLAYSSPHVLSPQTVYQIGMRLNEETKTNQFLYELETYNLLSAIGNLHRKMGLYHGQLHLGNWGVVIDESKGSDIYISDWGTAGFFGAFSAIRKSEELLSPYERAMCMDIQWAQSALTSVVFLRGDRIDTNGLADITRLISYGLSGYFQVDDQARYMQEIKKAFPPFLQAYVQAKKTSTSDMQKLIAGDAVRQFVYNQFFFYPEKSKYARHLAEKRGEKKLHR